MLTTTRNLYLTKLSFQTKADEFSFSEELENLLNHPSTAKLVRPNTVGVLQKLYLSLLAEKPSFELAFYKLTGQSSLLKDFFIQFINEGYELPQKSVAIEVFIGLTAKNQELDYLFRLLDTNILISYQARDLRKLLSYTFEKLITFIDMHLQEANGLSFEEMRLLCELIELLPADLFIDLPAQQLYQFFKEILPIFYDQFQEDLSLNEAHNHVSRIAGWYQVWYNHEIQNEAEILTLNDEYYELKFATIIKYVPSILWWQNGIFFRNETKKFSFGSPEFLHLACGGSVRQAMSTHPFTRRMAKVFCELPYDFDQTGKDIYIYCFSKSLHTGDQLTRLLQSFVGNYSQAERMRIELNRWNPVIQKLACPDFEEMVENRAFELLGYLTHILRDKPNFSVKKQNVARLLRASNDYYQLIRERAQARERQQLLRDQRRRKEEARMHSWQSHNRVKPLTIGRYKVSELTNKEQLHQEGRVMGHCVGSYWNNCKNGNQSIWSLRELDNGQWKSLVTIALSRNLFITEARSRFNALLKMEHKLLVQKWAKQNGLFKTGVLEEWDL